MNKPSLSDWLDEQGSDLDTLIAYLKKYDRACPDGDALDYESFEALRERWRQRWLDELAQERINAGKGDGR